MTRIRLHGVRTLVDRVFLFRLWYVVYAHTLCSWHMEDPERQSFLSPFDLQEPPPYRLTPEPRRKRNRPKSLTTLSRARVKKVHETHPPPGPSDSAFPSLPPAPPPESCLEFGHFSLWPWGACQSEGGASLDPVSQILANIKCPVGSGGKGMDNRRVCSQVHGLQTYELRAEGRKWSCAMD